MQINWFTVIAQVLNFFILVWLLKRYLYKPILDAIDEREKKIDAQLKDASDREAIAKKEQEDFRQKNEAFDQQKKTLMDKAVAETEAARQKLLEAARNEAGALQSKLEKASKEMQKNAHQAMVQKTKQEIFSVTRKALADLASVSLEEQATYVFVRRMNDLNEKEKQQFIAAFKQDSNPILVRSAFELPEKQQTEIKNAVQKILGTKPLFQFETKPELISGIELATNGYKLAWSISEYLNTMEKNIPVT